MLDCLLLQDDASLFPLDNLQNVYKIIVGTLDEWLVSALENLPNLIVAILVFCIFFYLSYLTRQAIRKLLNQVFDAPQISSLFSSIARVVVICIGGFIALETLGLSGTVTSLLAGAGIIGLAIGFAFQDMTENFIAGVAMGIRKPFKIGDVIKSDKIFGTVQAINLRNTIVETFFGQHEIVPNKHLFRNVVTNFNATRKRRIEIVVGIPYAQDIEEAASVITDAIKSLDLVVDKDDSVVFADEFGASSVNLKVWYWIDYPGAVGYIEARHAGFVAIKNALDSANITIPFPIRTLEFANEEQSKVSVELTNKQD
jgi:small-conductance mechanosensitive channel